MKKDKYGDGGFLSGLGDTIFGALKGALTGSTMGLPGMLLGAIGGTINKLEDGGDISDKKNFMKLLSEHLEFKEFDAPSHEQGGQKIDKNLNPSKDGIAEIEKKESAIVFPQQGGFVFSDKLKY